MRGKRVPNLTTRHVAAWRHGTRHLGGKAYPLIECAKGWERREGVVMVACGYERPLNFANAAPIDVVGVEGFGAAGGCVFFGDCASLVPEGTNERGDAAGVTC